MQKWDYLTVDAGHNIRGRQSGVRVSDGRTVPSMAHWPAFLQQLGEEGWELVSVIFGTSGHDEHGNALNTRHDFYFKRPRSER